MNLLLERSLTLMVSRTEGKQFEKMHRTIKQFRPDVAILYLSSRVVGAARKLLVRAPTDTWVHISGEIVVLDLNAGIIYIYLTKKKSKK